MLLRTKLGPPPVPTWTINRAHLGKYLQQITQYKLTLISAPAGFGKTTLLSAWYQAHPQQPIAWLALDGTDNDPSTFWRYLAASLEMVQPEITTELDRLLAAPQLPPATLLMTTLINAIDTQAQELVLLLDDYHLIETQAIHDGMSFLLKHMPSQLHLVILSRNEPPLPLASLRAQCQLQEVLMADLRLTLEETREFCAATLGPHVSQELTDKMDARIEGWIGGLQLTILALRGHTNALSFIDTFTGRHRHIVDYLVGEVLQQQPPAIQRFLLFTSIVEKFDASLCNALLETSDGQHILHTLEANNVFLIPLDEQRTWYRYHHLFCEALYQHLSNVHAALLDPLHQRASRWYGDQGFMLDALRHALAAHDLVHVADLLERQAHQPNTWGASELQKHYDYMNSVPETLLGERLYLCLLRGWTLLLQRVSGKEITLETIEQHTQMASNLLSRTTDLLASGILETVLAGLTLLRGELDRTITHASRALELLPRHHLVRTGAANMLFSTYKMRGNSKAAELALEELTVSGMETNDIHVTLGALFNLGQLQSTRGQLRRAAATHRRAYEMSQQRLSATFPDLSAIALSELALEWNEPDRATHYLEPQIALIPLVNDLQFLTYIYDVWARLEQVRGHQSAALEALEIQERLVRQHQVFAHSPLQSAIYAALEAQRAEIALECGDMPAANRWLAGYTPPEDAVLTQPQLQILTIFARVLLANQRYSQMLTLLQAPIQAASKAQNVLSLVPLLTLQAVALAAEGDQAQARSVTLTALSQAEEGGFLRTFLRAGEHMHALLESILATWPSDPAEQPSVSTDYIHRVLKAFTTSSARHVSSTPAPQPATGPDLLSKREREVLRWIADGLSDREIAEKLTLSESTVKTYARRIYARLDVKNRAQAVKRAHQLRLV